MNQYQTFLLIYLLLYFGVILAARMIMLYGNTRVNAAKKFGRRRTLKHAERIIQIALVLMLVIGLNYLFIEQNYQYFFPIGGLDLAWVKTTGFVLGVLGLLLTFAAQLQMKPSWRIGIDEEQATELVTTGFFAFSRNPIYLFLGLSFIGFFFMAPNVGSFVFLILMFYGVSQMIRDEEAFSQRQFGEAYAQYRGKVRRWL